MGYPLQLNLAGRLCLVVGAGSVGRRKLAALLAAGARVRLVDPQLPDATLPATVEQRPRPFRDEDLDEVVLAFAATAEATVNERVVALARKRGVFCGRADRPEAGDFALPATLRRGALTVAIATGGLSPTLAVLLRDRLAERLGSEWAALTRLAGALRRELLQAGRMELNRLWLQALLQGGIEARLAAADGAGLRALLLDVTKDEAMTTRLLQAIGEEA